MQILDGKLVAQQVQKALKAQLSSTQTSAAPPGLAVVLVGDDPASQVYVRNKIKACAEVGIRSHELRLPRLTTSGELRQAIESLNRDSSVHGILVQMPLPPQLNMADALSWIDPMKDADGLTVLNQGRLFAGQPLVLPCTPAGVMELLQYYKIPIRGRRAVIVGRSQIVGLPMAHLLLQKDATVTVCHSKTENLEEHTRSADLVVVAAGRPRLLGRSAFKKDTVVVDVGIHRRPESDGGGLCGDVRFEELEGWAHSATPVPGGVGPMTIAMLLKNTLRLFEVRGNNGIDWI